MNRILSLVLLSLLSLAPAQAQSTWATPQTAAGGPTVTGGVGLCLNGSGLAVPCGASTPTYVYPGTGALWTLSSGTAVIGQVGINDGTHGPATVKAASTAAAATDLALVVAISPNGLGTSGTPFTDNIAQWGGATLGAATAWGTAPSGNVASVNSFSLGGNSGGYDKLVKNTPTVANSAHTYTSATNAVSIGGLQTLAVFRTTTQPSGLLSYVQALSLSGGTTALTVYAWSHNPTASTCTDAAQFVQNAADTPFLIPGFPVTITPAVGIGSATPTLAAAAFVPPIPVSNLDSSATANVYLCVLGNATVTPPANDYVFTISVMQD